MADISIQELSFTKDWRNPTDFPTFQTDERQVRDDQQILHDETRDYINNVIGPAFRTVEANRKELESTVERNKQSVDNTFENYMTREQVEKYVTDEFTTVIGNALSASY